MVGLILIALGTGGIKPCVAAFGGDQFEEHQVRGGLIAHPSIQTPSPRILAKDSSLRCCLVSTSQSCLSTNNHDCCPLRKARGQRSICDINDSEKKQNKKRCAV